MRIVFFVHHFPPDVNSTGRLMSQIASGLRERGHDAAIITSFPHYEKFRIWPRYRRKLFQCEKMGGTEIWRVWCFARGRKSMRNRLLNYLSFNFMATIVGLWVTRRTDVLLATNGSFFTGIAAWVAGRRHVPFIYNVQDLYPEVPILAGQLRSPLAITVLRRAARLMYEKAALVTVISPAFREYLCERSGLTSEKIQVVPNFVDTNIIRPLPRENPYAARMDFTHRFVVAHSGNLGYVYDLMTLIDAAKILSDQDDIVFAIIGDGVLNEALKRKAELNRLNNVRFLPFQPEEDLPWLRASIDVHLALYVPGAARYSMPSKVYEIMASGRPVLASAESGSDVYRLLRESRAGVCIDPSDAGGLAEAVIQLRDDPAGRDEMGALGRRHVEENYSVPRVVSQYEQLLAEVAERSPR